MIIPTYNEAENISELIPRIRSALKEIAHEIIVVDDSSPDNTAEVARELGAIVHVRPKKMGLATAFLDGLKIAQGRYVCLMDADLQHPPEVLPQMLSEAIRGADIVVASRYVEGGGTEGWSWIRKLISRGARLIAYILIPETRGVRDPVSGMFMVKRDVLNGVVFSPRGYKILLEILVKARYGKVVEVPYVFKRRLRGESKLDVGEIFNYLKLLLDLTNYRTLKFMVVGASGIFVNQGVLSMLIELYKYSHWLASPLAIETATLSNFVLNDRWTFRGRWSGNIAVRCLKYHLSVAVGNIVNYLVYLGLVDVGLHYVAANLIGIALGFVANYVLSEVVVWR